MKTTRSTPRWLRRTPWERGTATLIGLGLVMLMQPWSLDGLQLFVHRAAGRGDRLLHRRKASGALICLK